MQKDEAKMSRSLPGGWLESGHGAVVVFVKDFRDPLERRKKLMLRPWASIKDIKDQLQVVFNVPSNAQKLFYQGRELKNAHNLQQCGIYQDNAVVDFVARRPQNLAMAYTLECGNGRISNASISRNSGEGSTLKNEATSRVNGKASQNLRQEQMPVVNIHPYGAHLLPVALMKITHQVYVQVTPRLVELPTNSPIVQLSASKYHTIALNAKGECFVWGFGKGGRLGTGNEFDLGQVWQFGYGSYRPSRVNFPSAASTSAAGAVMCDTWVPTCKQRGLDIVGVSCAQNHSIALSASGSVFTWGHNVPALSHQPSGSPQDQHTSKTSPMPSPSAPQMVSLASYGPVASVCASQDHCAVVTQQGDLVTWGCGQQGVLGHGRGNTWQPSPKRVAGVKKAVAVAAGHQHTAVLVAPVHPDFNSVAGNAAQDVMPSLVELVERKIAAYVDVTNCALVWQYAERYAAFRLQKYCLEYMRSNWDAVLDAVGRDRMETLFDIMLPPTEELESEEKARADTPVGVVEKPVKEKKTTKQSSATKGTSKRGSTPSVIAPRKDLHATDEDLLAVTLLESSSRNLSATSSKPNGRRKSKNSKFVPLTSLLTSKTAAALTRGGDTSCPWSMSAASFVDEEKSLVPQSKPVAAASPVFSPTPLTPHAFSEAFPLPGSSLRKASLDGTTPRRRKASIGSLSSTSPQLSFSPLPVSGKHMLGYDGVEREQVTAFSLDAFLKQPARRGARAKCPTPAAPTWSSPSTGSTIEQKPRPKTLKEIQEEEEAAAARERETKERLGGGVAPLHRSQSTVNSWGLFRPPDHVSLADVQKLQEEQEFLEQQRQILAEIEREQAAKAQVTATATSGGVSRSKRSKATGGNPRRRRVVHPGAGGVASAAATSGPDGAGDSQSKQNKQKKAKERKAARKAAGETFAPSRSSSNASTQPTQPAGRKKSSAQHSNVKSSDETPPKPPQSRSRRRKGKTQATSIAA
ncbi:hypothetical protein AM588_10007782 [Phytophthora nicotianae]|uniref:Ubiquitin-like domain-containing protein n=1 Tax=Phytophthora nicotianae TaxID=4792 RepID=A0A0W8DGF3_PHYNI|nr:hypothetical protein AM588_10007782 [Phytophthora nicotianae]